MIVRKPVILSLVLLFLLCAFNSNFFKRSIRIKLKSHRTTENITYEHSGIDKLFVQKKSSTAIESSILNNITPTFDFDRSKWIDRGAIEWYPDSKLPLGMNLANLVHVASTSLLSNRTMKVHDSPEIHFAWSRGFECEQEVEAAWSCIFKLSSPLLLDIASVQPATYTSEVILVLHSQALALQWVLNSKTELLRRDVKHILNPIVRMKRRNTWGESISLHVRRGDSCFYYVDNIKDLENFRERFENGLYQRPCFDFSLYMSVVEEICLSSVCNNVIYLSTDSQNIAQQTKNYPKYHWIFLNLKRNVIFGEERLTTSKRSFIERKAAKWSSRHIHEHTTAFIAEFELMRLGDIFVGTSSTVSRLFYLSILARKKKMFPYYFLDHPICLNMATEEIDIPYKEKLAVSLCYCWPVKYPASKICSDLKRYKKQIRIQRKDSTR